MLTILDDLYVLVLFQTHDLLWVMGIYQLHSLVVEFWEIDIRIKPCFIYAPTNPNPLLSILTTRQIHQRDAKTYAFGTLNVQYSISTRLST